MRHLGYKFVDRKLKRRGYQFVVGEWTDPIDDPVPCVRGYHYCKSPRELILAYQNYGPVMLHVEAEPGLDDGNKTVTSRLYVHRVLSWDDTIAQLFAADCAERVLPIFETHYPADQRPRLAIEAARQFALGQIGEAAEKAAGDAAGYAAWDAAGYAAKAVAWAAAWAAFGYASGHASGYAAGCAARAAAWDETWAAGTQWQTKRLIAYLHGWLPAPARKYV